LDSARGFEDACDLGSKPARANFAMAALKAGNNALITNGTKLRQESRVVLEAARALSTPFSRLTRIPNSQGNFFAASLSPEKNCVKRWAKFLPYFG
jgi:hypothetical protein